MHSFKKKKGNNEPMFKIPVKPAFTLMMVKWECAAALQSWLRGHSLPLMIPWGSHYRRLQRWADVIKGGCSQQSRYHWVRSQTAHVPLPIRQVGARRGGVSDPELQTLTQKDLHLEATLLSFSKVTPKEGTVYVFSPFTQSNFHIQFHVTFTITF